MNDIMESKSVSIETLLSGFHGSDLITIAGKPGMFKTFMALKLATRMAFPFEPIVFFSIEISKDGLIKRLYKMQKWSAENIQEFERGEFQSSISDLSIIDNPHITFSELEQHIKNISSENTIKAVFINYLGLLVSNNTEEYQHKHQANSIIKLKALAIELNIPIIVNIQFHRDSKNPSPETVQSSISSDEAFQCIDQLLITQESDTQKEVIIANAYKRSQNNVWNKEAILWTQQI